MVYTPTVKPNPKIRSGINLNLKTSHLLLKTTNSKSPEKKIVKTEKGGGTNVVYPSSFCFREINSNGTNSTNLQNKKEKFSFLEKRKSELENIVPLKSGCSISKKLFRFCVRATEIKNSYLAKKPTFKSIYEK